MRGVRRAEELLTYDIRSKRRLLTVASNGDTCTPGIHWRLIDTQIQNPSAGEYTVTFYVRDSMPHMPCEDIKKVSHLRLNEHAYGTMCRSIGRNTSCRSSALDVFLTRKCTSRSVECHQNTWARKKLAM